MSRRVFRSTKLAAGITWMPAVVVGLGWAVAARSADQVNLQKGPAIRGTLVSVSPDVVEIEDGSGLRKLSIVDVREISFDGEPESLRSARRVLARGDAPGALEELDKIEGDDVKALAPRLREEYDFLKLAAAARTAATAAEAATAEQQLAAFLQRNTRSHNFYAGSRLLGDLRARQGKFAPAAEAYAALDRGPAALRVQAAAARAGLLVKQGKLAEAIKEFEAADKVTTPPDDAASARQKLDAALGRARCLALTGQAPEGVALARGVIRSVDAPDKGFDASDKELLARAYAALGSCQRAAGGMDEDAVISFLTVDLVFNLLPEAHAEALFNLVDLWTASNRPERAREASDSLTTNYPDSPWAAKLPGGNGPS